ncbi:MAG: TRAP transporter substrate-binding protein [Candidatus Rokubacteria bacterium]|nr:TRAP transporter substrate-binding protein [Candidatus Rokubacteria bacterium]
MKTAWTRALGATVIALALAAVTSAQDLPALKVKAIGLNSNTVASDIDEKTFWTKTIPEASKGRISADFVPIDQSGIKDFQIARISKLGATDFAAGDISKLAGDDPVFEGCDLAGLALDIRTARKACEAWKPVMAKVLEEKFGTKLLAIGTNPPQVFWCRVPLSGVADLRGKKVRVFNKTMTDFINAVGGTTVSLPFGEVVPALQRGVVDCAVTGTLSGNTAGWPEVTTHLYPLYMGWSINYQSVTLPSWQKFDAKARDFFVDQFRKLEDTMWKTGTAAVADAENCNFGKDPCKMGKKAKMTLVQVSDSDKKRHRELMENVVLTNWGKRCGRECAQRWNDTVGKVVNLRIPVDKI